MGLRRSLASGSALGFAAVLLLGGQALAATLSFPNGNPGDWSDTFGSPLSVTTSNTGGPAGAGYTTLPNTDGFTDAGPTTQFGNTSFDTSPYQFLSQSIGVYLDPTATAFQSGQFMLDEALNATVYNNYGGSSTPTLWGAEEDIIATGTASGITFSGSTGNGAGGQTFTPLGTITQAGWYDLQMTWTRGDSPTDPVSTTLSVTDVTSSLTVGSTTNPASTALNGGETDLWQSQYLSGPGYMWVTYWNSNFGNGQLQVSNVQSQGQPVPEPGSMSLFLVGATAVLGLAIRRRA